MKIPGTKESKIVINLKFIFRMIEFNIQIEILDKISFENFFTRNLDYEHDIQSNTVFIDLDKGTFL